MNQAIFEPTTYPRRIVLVGAGGTGAQWARSIARTLYDMRRRGLHTPGFTIVDPDTVEAHNVGRQLFTPADLGLNKAQVLARRYAYGLGLEVSYIPEPFEAERHVERGDCTLICGAVDNHLARQEMARVRLNEPDGCIWIDAGNHETSGQVVIGNTACPGSVKIREDGSTIYLPVASLLFPALLEPPDGPDATANLSCAELVEAGAQHLLVNDLVASVAAAYTWKLLMRQPITSFLTYVDVDGLTVRSVQITQAALDSYLQVEEEAEVAA